MEDRDAADVAEDLGLYTESGEPDVDRAGRLMQRLDARSERVVAEQAGRHMEPVLADRAEKLRQAAYAVRDEDGQAYADREVVDTLLSNLPVELQAKPDVVRFTLALARGIGGASSPEERSAAISTAISTIERKAAASRNLSDDQWRKLRENDSSVLDPVETAPRTVRMSVVQQKAAEARGISPARWRELTDRKPGDRGDAVLE